MTVEKKNPNATDVAAASNAITAINNRDNRIETAAFGHSSFTLSGTSATMTSAQLWDGAVIVLAGSPSGSFTLNVPANKRGIVTFINTTAVQVTVRISGQPVTEPVIPPKSASTSDVGQEAMIRIDATNALWAVKPHFAMSAAEYTALPTKDARAVYYTI